MTITVAGLEAHLGLTLPAGTPDADYAATVVDAVNTWVGALPVLTDRADPAAPWPADVVLGATLLAAHEYHSRSAPYGRAGLDALGGYQAAYADPEIARLLRLRRWARPFTA